VSAADPALGTGNHMRSIHLPRALVALALVLAAGCEAKKSANPLSPTVAGPIPGVEISAPKLLEPAQGFKFKESQQPIRLLIENSSSSGVRPISYVFEVATDDAFTTKVFARAGVPPGDGGRTSVQIDKLDNGRSYYWRARAEDGANNGPFAAAQFEVLPKPQLDPPSPISPVNNERVTTQRPDFRFGNSGRNAAIGVVYYEIQVAKDQAFTQLGGAGFTDESSGQTAFTAPVNLDYDLTYYWRARATDGETSSAWMATQVFRSPNRPSTPPPSPPGPGPQPGGSCASNNGPAIVDCVSAKYPDKLVAGISLDQRKANMAFLRDRIIESGKCGGLDLGWNLKRGGPDLSIDFLAWRRSDGDMGVDIGFDYDNTSTPLKLYWGEAGLGATYKAYPSVPCQ
jgi:hypothetical protein